MKIFDSVAQMKLATIKAGQYVETFGYYAKGDAGAARYLVVASQTADGYGDHTLANGTVAVLQADGGVKLEQFGAAPNVNSNYGPNIRAFFSYLKTNKIKGTAGHGHFYADYFDIPSGVDFEGVCQASFGLGNEFGSDYLGTWFRHLAGTTGDFICFETLEGADGNDRVGPLQISKFGVIGNFTDTRDGLVLRSRAMALENTDNVLSTRPTIIQSLTFVHDVMIRDCGRDGYWLPAGHGGSNISRINSYFNGGDGGKLDCSFGTQESTLLTSIDGDGNNGNCTLRVYKLGSIFESDGKYSVLDIRGVRSEQRLNTNNSVKGNEHCIIFDACNSGIVNISGLYHQSIIDSDEPSTPLLIANQNTGFAPTINCTGIETAIKLSKNQLPANTPPLLDDTVNNRQISSNASSFTYTKNLNNHVLMTANDTDTKPWHSVGGSNVDIDIGSGGFQSIGTTPVNVIYETDGPVNRKLWSNMSSGGEMTYRTGNDDGSGLNVWMSVARSGNVVTEMRVRKNFKVDNAITLPGLLTYADEAAALAGGLASGRVYKTATGELRIKL